MIIVLSVLKHHFKICLVANALMDTIIFFKVVVVIQMFALNIDLKKINLFVYYFWNLTKFFSKNTFNLSFLTNLIK